MKFNMDDLIESGLVKKKTYDNGLSVFKYARKVFYDNLWNQDSRLLDARGLVLDGAGDAVIWPFTKVFNFGENGTTCDEDQLVVYVRKVNGFMLSVRTYNDELVYSTTGTLDSDFVKLGKLVVEANLNVNQLKELAKDFTFIFEITDPSDPHIVEESYGAWLIGMRDMTNPDGECEMVLEPTLDFCAKSILAKRPEHGVMYFKDLLVELNACKHEGYMVRSLRDGDTILKLKSPYYLTKKFLMRIGDKRAESLWAGNHNWKEWIDEEFYCVVNYVIQNWTASEWSELDETERSVIIEGYFYE